LAHRLAYTAVHEAFHTFGLHHTFGGISDGDVINAGASAEARENPFIVTRFGLTHVPPGAVFSNYEFVADDLDIGLRDDDGDDIPNLSYVTGTGLHDRITITRDASDVNLVHATVAAYSNSVGGALFQQETYSINLLTDTEGEILIDASHGNDLIEIDPRIPASFRIRTLTGNDEVVLTGNGASALEAFVFDREAGNDTFTIDFDNGDPLPQAGFDFNFIGGAGTDNTVVIDPNGVERAGYFVNTLTDGADLSLGGRADASAADDDQTTLRAAIQEANFLSTPSYIFVPQGTYNLALPGSGGDTQGDLDISKNLTIIGAGAGVSIIKATSLGDRLFDVNGTTARLKLDRVTLTGGTTSDVGGGIRVASGASLDILDSAFVNLETGNAGGGIHFLGQTGATSGLTVRRSVFTNDRALAGPGGAITFIGGAAHTITVGESIFALNLAYDDEDVELTSVYTQGQGHTKINEGYNLTDDNTSGFFKTNLGDHIGTVNHVVTSLADTYTHTDNDHAVSLREAIDLANMSTENSQVVWMPAWQFVLTLDRGLNATDTSIEYGDLDIKDTLTVRGAGLNKATVRWKPGEVDAVFDLQGDYTGNGLAGSPDDGGVGGSDGLIHQQQVGQNNGTGIGQLSADGDDDGDVDGDDLAIWQLYYDNYFTLIGVTAILS